MDVSQPRAQHALAVRMAELAREIAAPRPLERVLTDVTTVAVELIPGADLAGVLLVKKNGEFQSLADTDGVVAKLDELQHDFGEGPCAEAETTGTVLAAHAAAAILAARRGEQLQSAVSTRDRIGQAKGIVMERFGVDDVRAFELLRMLSQEAG